MSESVSQANRYLAALELVHSLAPTDRLHRVDILAKRLEIKLAAARLAQAEYCFEALSARRDFLAARCAEGRASRREREALDWASEALPLSALTVEEMVVEFDRHKRELDSLIETALQAA